MEKGFEVLEATDGLLEKEARNVMNQNNRADKRLPLQKECTLVNQFGFIVAQTVDRSKNGLGLKTDRTLPFKNGCELTVFMSRMKLPQAKIMWIKKDFKNTIRLGLKFLPGRSRDCSANILLSNNKKGFFCSRISPAKSEQELFKVIGL
jgi:hypothetical protein